MKPYLDDGDVRLILGDCMQVMAGLEAESVDAVVTDPPYGLEFMGKEWDRLSDEAPRKSQTPSPAQANYVLKSRGEAINRLPKDHGQKQQEWHQAWATQALRVLRPGGHLLAFGGTRTFHRLTCAIEDAGFEVRDCLSWLYGSGFPKSLDVSKAIDRAAGAEREVGIEGPYTARRPREVVPSVNAYRDGAGDRGSSLVTAPATPEAAAWQGWGTALKPAWEPIVLARKPLAGTVAANVLAHGTGALNVDGCRVEGVKGTPASPRRAPQNAAYGDLSNDPGTGSGWDPNLGRWPANVVLSHTPDCREVGTRKVKAGPAPYVRSVAVDGGLAGVAKEAGGSPPTYADPDGTETVAAWECSPDCPVRLLDEEVGELHHQDPATRGVKGNAVGVTGFTPSKGGGWYPDRGGPSRFFYTAKASSAERDGASHPTVKPLALMRWLVRLVTPPGGLVLDPFAGSGTTGLACRNEGLRALLIERELEYCEMAAHRLRQLSLFGESHA